MHEQCYRRSQLYWHYYQNIYFFNKTRFSYSNLCASFFESLSKQPCCCLVTKSCLTLCNPMDCSLPGSSVRGISQARILEWVVMSPSRGIFPTQRSNPGLLRWRWILYCLSHQESPRIVVWVAYPFSRRTSQPRNRTGVSRIAGGDSLSSQPPRKPKNTGLGSLSLLQENFLTQESNRHLLLYRR